MTARSCHFLPLHSKFSGVSSISVHSLEVLVSPSYAGIDFNETNLLYIPSWAGIEYDSFVLESTTISGDAVILSVEYYGSDQTVVIDTEPPPCFKDNDEDNIDDRMPEHSPTGSVHFEGSQVPQARSLCHQHGRFNGIQYQEVL
mmetsp:Transcript_23320/g.42285  ORF Transcript_23320/g.42285 Transcript_23320/m.42285 type:complete len:144 (+) Transcript_23320:977-1408(+)